MVDEPFDAQVCRAGHGALTDGALVRRCQTGDQHAWAELVHRHNRQLRAIARSCGLGDAAVDDVVQTTWARLYTSVDRLRDVEAVRGWLATTARRESICVRRGERRSVPLADSEIDARALSTKACWPGSERGPCAARSAASADRSITSWSCCSTGLSVPTPRSRRWSGDRSAASVRPAAGCCADWPPSSATRPEGHPDMSSSNRPVDGGARVVPAPLTERAMSGKDGAVAGAVRVLVVDDDESFRAAVGAMLLDDERFVVVGSVVSGEAAIDVAASTVCDLVVMDVRMPGLGGPAAAGELQRRQPDIVIVLVSTGDVSEPKCEASVALSCQRSSSIVKRWLEPGRRAAPDRKEVSGEHRP